MSLFTCTSFLPGDPQPEEVTSLFLVNFLSPLKPFSLHSFSTSLLLLYSYPNQTSSLGFLSSLLLIFFSLVFVDFDLLNMGSSSHNHFSVECRPKMLKDFLVEDSRSYSPSGFRLFRRKPCDSAAMKTLTAHETLDLNSPRYCKLFRSRSKSKVAASTTISAFQAMINAVKNIHFAAVKSPSILPRSLSRRLSKKKSQQDDENEVRVTITVKDIIRWKSFQDIVEEKSPPSDLPPSPHHCTTTNTTWSSSTTPRSGSSWCDSDFTSEYLPSWNSNLDECGDNEVVQVGKKFSPCVGQESMERTKTCKTVGPKEEEEEQHSPVSVIQFKCKEDDEESSSSFDQSFASVERTREKIMEKIRRFENLAKLDPVSLEKWMSMEENSSSGEDDHEEEEEINEVEENARKLLDHVKETGPKYCNSNVDHLLLDFFRDELTTRRTDERRKAVVDLELLKKAKAWIDGEDSLWIGWEEDRREGFVRDMDKEGKWNKFEEEQQEFAMEIQNEVLGLLVEELLLDVISW